MYIPELLKVSVSNLENGKIVAGTKITWNADPKNKKGIIIGAEYRKIHQIDQSIATENPDKIIRGSSLSDTGSYTVTSNDLSFFPKNSVITFTIGRAGYKIINDESGNNDVLVGAYTLVRTDFNITK